jgi:iron complex transport system substrate-binding protein
MRRDAAGDGPTPRYPLAAAAWSAAFGTDAAPPFGPFAPATLKEVLSAALDLGNAAGRLPDAMRVLADFELRLDRLAATLRIDRRAGTVAGRPPPRVAIITDVRGDEVVLAGRWVPDLASAAGARALLADAGGDDAVVRFEEIVDVEPDRVIFALRGRTTDESLSLVRNAAGRIGWVGVDERLVGRYSLLDGVRFVNEPEPALARSIELIALACHGAVSGVRASPDEIALAPASTVGIAGLPA